MKPWKSPTSESVYTAGAGGMMEVEMGKLAQSNGGSDGVKDYGKMLEKDHEEIDHMQTLTGKDFDNAFIPMMIDDHTKDIAEFKKAVASNENAGIKAFAKSTLPTLETHLSKAKSLKAKM
ncbi:DUF4142 domain-containing protein [Flavihumibacter fluvii]|uniref:DUF4142 domain-containing protein n=1 Tax=Flavihumibacter fluvii TaxID=2838157 RepID=UPI001BDE2B0C|nr:DUF4142 domain-containing protein [Flavihumibacter fluvii]ULQ50962.1 DUF4142 domain-containing protein [Flavihumibacter fluvii]